MLNNPVPFTWRILYAGPRPEGAVVALRERETGRLYEGRAGEAHCDLQDRENLGASTDPWLDAGFVYPRTGQFITTAEARQLYREAALRAEAKA